MKCMLEYMVVIIEDDGNIVKYPIEFGMRHQNDCYDKFAMKKGYNCSNLDYIVQRGNCVFYNCGNGMFVVRLPYKLTDEQLYSLDYVENWLKNVSYMEVCIEDRNYKESFVFEENIKYNFSNKVIQYYYNNIGKKAK